MTYTLNSSKTTAAWAGMMTRMSTERLKQNSLNHRHGFAQPEEIQRNTDRIAQVAKMLGLPFDGVSQESLNQLHAHFPPIVQKRGAQYHLAHELNLLIHWLEYERQGVQMLTADFNHDPTAYALTQNIEPKEMGNFTMDFAFGQLHLHYVHIGRFFWEMFAANDLICPRSQHRPQHRFNATCSLVFGETRPVVGAESYYARRGGKGFFGYAFDDPRLAKGFFKLGQLDGYETLVQREALRAQLKNARVASWGLCA